MALVVTIASSVSLLMPDQAADIVGRWRLKLVDALGNETTVERRPMIVSQF